MSTTIDALAGLARARTKTTNVVSGCLGEVYADYGSVQSVGIGSGHYATAWDAWVYCDENYKHPGDRNPPAGVPVIFGPSPSRTDKNKNAGDIAISMGAGLLWVTDVAGKPGHTGIMTIAAREKQTARPYVGWMGMFLGHVLVNYAATATASSGGTAISPAPPAKKKRAKYMDYGMVQVTDTQECFKVRQVDGAMRGPLNMVEISSMVSLGVTVVPVSRDQLNGAAADAPGWWKDATAAKNDLVPRI